MNIFAIINSIAKLKAGVGAIIGNDSALLQKSKEIYFRNSLVVSCTDEETKIADAACTFKKFLEKDERLELNKELTL
jgi:hypothetical protein